MDRKDLLETMVRMAQLDHKDQPDRKDLLETMVLTEHRDP